MSKRTALLASLASLVCTASASAQAPANDDCVNASVITTGLTAFDTTSATTDGQTLDVLVCDMGPFGSEDIFNDIWYCFTAPATDVYEVTNFGLAGFDTRLAVYDNGCGLDDPALVIACNDDFDGNSPFEAGLSFSAVIGTDYKIRLGGFGATTVGTGNTLIQAFVPPMPELNPSNGNYYFAVSNIGISWDDAKLAAEGMSFMGVQGHLATITDQPENDFIYAALGGVHRHWVGGFQDLMDPMYSEPAGGWKWITGEPFVYTNWLVGEPNNTGAFPSEDFLELLDDGAFGETWNDAHPMEHPEGYVVEFPTGTGNTSQLCNGDGGDQLGCTDCPCGNNAPMGTVGGCLNSSLSSARLLSSGSASVSLPSGDTTDLRFSIEGAPPTAFCILNSGDNLAPQGMANPCFGLNSGAQSVNFDGLRCAVQNTLRHGGRSADMNGEVGVTNNPWGGEGGPPIGLAVAGGFASGQTRYFQVINRDDPLAVCGRGLNTSQAVGVTFTP